MTLQPLSLRPTPMRLRSHAWKLSHYVHFPILTALREHTPHLLSSTMRRINCPSPYLAFHMSSLHWSCLGCGDSLFPWCFFSSTWLRGHFFFPYLLFIHTPVSSLLLTVQQHSSLFFILHKPRSQVCLRHFPLLISSLVYPFKLCSWIITPCILGPNLTFFVKYPPLLLLKEFESFVMLNLLAHWFWKRHFGCALYAWGTCL